MSGGDRGFFCLFFSVKYIGQPLSISKSDHAGSQQNFVSGCVECLG